MPIIHYFSDREQKKLNIKIFSIFLIVVGSILTTYFLASNNIKPIQNNSEDEQPQTVEKNLCIDLNIDNETITKIQNVLVENKIELKTVSDFGNCKLEIVRNPEDINPYTLLSSKVYVPVTNIFNSINSITKAKLVESLNQQKYDKYSLIWDKEVDKFLRSKYEFGVGQTTYSQNEIEKKLSSKSNYIALIPFDDVNPKYKVLSIDNFDLINDDISITSYPLTDSYWIKGDEELRKSVSNLLTPIFPQINYDRSKLTKIILTGSSLVGADKYNVNILTRKKSDYMIGNLFSIINKSDLLHISNEVSIYNSCIQKIQSSYLCTLEKDMSPIKSLGVDVVGVTGNHIMDFGYDTFTDTLDWYRDNKIKTFGGGKNETEAHTPAVIIRNGVKFAFIGYNFIPPYSYYSSGNRGGSANVSLSLMRKDIERAKSLADIVIVDMNWGDELQTRIDKTQIENATYALDYGATIINGVNSYSTLGFDLSESTSAFYGLGGFINPVAKNGIVVEHLFYNKRYFGINIIPIMYDNSGIISVASGKVKEELINNIYNQSRIIYDKN